MNIADKMHDPLQGIPTVGKGEGGVESTRGVVGQSGDDAAFGGGTVAGEGEGAKVRRGVGGVDPVPGGGVAAVRGVREVVGPGGGGQE